MLAAYFGKICIQLAAGKIQISFSWSLAACKLDILYCMAASRMQFGSGWRWLNEICIRMAANWMKFASGWRLTEWNLHPACSFINHNMYSWNINIKPKCGQQTIKALSNHESFSPSQSHETVSLKWWVCCYREKFNVLHSVRQNVGAKFFLITS